MQNVECKRIDHFCILHFDFCIVLSLRNSQAHSATALAPASHQAAGSLGGVEVAYSSCSSSLSLSICAEYSREARECQPDSPLYKRAKKCYDLFTLANIGCECHPGQ